MLAIVQEYPLVVGLAVFMLFIVGGLFELAFLGSRGLAAVTWGLGGWALIWLPFSADNLGATGRGVLAIIAIGYCVIVYACWRKFSVSPSKR
jgi:hypothetical protein